MWTGDSRGKRLILIIMLSLGCATWPPFLSDRETAIYGCLKLTKLFAEMWRNCVGPGIEVVGSSRCHQSREISWVSNNYDDAAVTKAINEAGVSGVLVLTFFNLWWGVPTVGVRSCGSLRRASVEISVLVVVGAILMLFCVLGYDYNP